MKKSISILTALIMAVTMVLSTGTAVAATTPGTEGAQETAISYSVKEEVDSGEPVPVNYEDSIAYAAEDLNTAGQKTMTCVISVIRNYDMAYAILDIVNKERKAAGQKTLSMDKNLLNVAMLRAAETAVFYDHTRPNGTDCYTADTKDNMFAENIAAGYNSAESVMTAWMNSEGHRTNILRSAAKSIGVGVVAHNGYIFFAQCFGRNNASGTFTKPATDTTTYSVNFVSQIDKYYLTPELDVYDNALQPGQVTTARMRMLNASFPYTYAIFDNSCVSYSLTDTNCVKFDKSTNKLTALKEGATTLKATVSGTTYSKSITVTAPDQTVSGHAGKPISVYVTSAYDEAITANRDYVSVNVASKTESNGAYIYKLDVTFSKGVTSQTVSIKGSKSSTIALLVATVSDHNYRDQAGTPATCTTPGKTAGKICTICYQTTGDVTEIPALGHDIIIKPAVAATCTTNGKTEGQWCQRCGTTLVQQQTVPKKEHDITVTNNADGSRVEACKNCSYKVTYSGSGEPVVSTSDVTRIYGSNRYLTSFKAADQLKSELGVSKFDTIIVAYGGNYADALAGSYLAAKEKAPILLIDGSVADQVTTYILENLKTGGKVYVLGGEGVVKKSWLHGIEFKRLGGNDRYETNLMILDEAGVDPGAKMMVCTGSGFADSLSVSATGNPILLVEKTLNSSQKAYMGTLDIETYYLIGGTAAVSKSVQTDCLRYSNVRRLNGNNRYETSVLVGYYLFDMQPERAVLAYAMNFPDGLSAGPLAYTMNAPLILTNTGSEYRAWEFMWDADISSGYVLGGPGLISDKSVRTIFNMQNSAKINVK